MTFSCINKCRLPFLALVLNTITLSQPHHNHHIFTHTAANKTREGAQKGTEMGKVQVYCRHRQNKRGSTEGHRDRKRAGVPGTPAIFIYLFLFLMLFLYQHNPLSTSTTPSLLGNAPSAQICHAQPLNMKNAPFVAHFLF